MGSWSSVLAVATMASPKLLLLLLVAAATLAAPQINEQKVVGDVLSEIGPRIQEILASLTSRYGTTSAISSNRLSSSSSGSSVASVTASVVSELEPRISSLIARA